MQLNIPTDPKHDICTGRNGTFCIKELVVFAHSDSETGQSVFIDGVSARRGITLNAGFSIGTKTMDQLALEWVKARGLILI